MVRLDELTDTVSRLRHAGLQSRIPFVEVDRVFLAFHEGRLSIEEYMELTAKEKRHAE